MCKHFQKALANRLLPLTAELICSKASHFLLLILLKFSLQGSRPAKTTNENTFLPGTYWFSFATKSIICVVNILPQIWSNILLGIRLSYQPLTSLASGLFFVSIREFISNIKNLHIGIEENFQFWFIWKNDYLQLFF